MILRQIRCTLMPVSKRNLILIKQSKI
uniref:Uncharacterized protein n=1 Tax=Wuchereria bancrofti TaxID=6293 RepID=A0A1I8EQY5_WUCBA